MLSREQIQANKEEFIGLIKSISRDGFRVDALLEDLERSDFFYAPASTKYHAAYEGGLCEHSLNVYYNLVKLLNMKAGLDSWCYDENSIKIVALLHDISKMNIYEKTFKNVKVYGKPFECDKQDENGYFRWVSQAGYKTRDKKFLYGNHEMTSEYIARQYLPLTIDESVAILHHMGSLGHDSAPDDIAGVYTQYQLSLFLHFADMLATYVDERLNDE